MPETKQKITDGFTQSVANSPAPIKEKATKQFLDNQAGYANKITHAFSDSLQRIFITASVLMLVAAVLVFLTKENMLRSASPEDTPGEA